MLKKTTIYLEEAELEKLKKISFLLDISMADLIRKAIDLLHKSMSKDEINAIKALSKINIGSKIKTKGSK